MAKVTSKLQVTLPKALATQYRIRPGDEILWVASGDAIRVVPTRNLAGNVAEKDRIAERLRLFDEATERLRRRYKRNTKAPDTNDRGWTREELYEDRVRPR
jgi:bifunctional DNA-binding transcriptional regulator/antitoxin component of YhaV-PrlF toxin-antitoxin module